MIIKAIAPSRISLFGGGTDLSSYYKKYGGIVINLAINLRTHLTVYTQNDIFQFLESELPNGIKPDLFYAITKHYNLGSMHHLTVKSEFDGVIGAGLGSSGSFSVALVKALSEKKDKIALANEAYSIEKTVNPCGKQDHFASSFGGLNVFWFGAYKDDFATYERLIVDHLASYLVLFYTGGKRESGIIQKNFKHLNTKQLKALHAMRDITLLATKAIQDGRMEIVAKLLNTSYEMKKTLGVGNSTIDFIIKYGKESGAMAGKLMGAGNSGYILFMVEPSKRKEFIEKMKEVELEETNFSPDFNGVETRIL